MSACGCGCEGACGCGTRAEPPGIGDPLSLRHSSLMRRMTQRLAGARGAGVAPLADWTTREPSDPGIALLDAQALALHVLGWNIHRLWADGALPDSEDAQAMGALARLLGHLPRPSLAASTVISLDLDDIEAAPETVDLPQGLKIASVPGKDELPQVFETDAPLRASKAWNRLQPVRVRPNPAISQATAAITLEGAAPRARPGDLVLVFAGSSQWLSARIVKVERPVPDSPDTPATTVLTLASQALVPCASDFATEAFRNQVILLGDRASAFGSTAADLSLFSTAQLKDIGQMGANETNRPADWKGLVMTAPGSNAANTLDLEAVHDQAMAGRAVLFAAFDDRPPAQMGRITTVSEGARNGFGLSAKVSRITVAGINLATDSFAQKVRQTTIHIETGRERLAAPPADQRVPDPATPDRIVVEGTLSFEPGRALILLGTEWGAGTGQPVGTIRRGEVATVLRTEAGLSPGSTRLILTAPLAFVYHAEKLEIHGNCVAVSQGETPSAQIAGPEVLGRAIASDALPRFALKGGPVAQVPADGPRGFAPALTLRVGARAYDRVESLFGVPADARVYRFAPNTPLGPLVEFPGSLPSGQTVTASYRTGGGPAGNVAAGALTTVMTPVTGLRGATNPFAATGGAEAETPDDLRLALPASVRTLDRAVALEDYEAFARDYRGVGKALASELRQGMRQILCLTIADTAFASPVAGSDLARGLRDALAEACPPGRTIRIEGFESLTATVDLAFAHDPAFERAGVEAALRAALLAAFAPAVRPFGRALHMAEVLAAAQAVTGVLAARITAFALPGGPAPDAGRLLCPLPRFEAPQPGAIPVFRPAGLIALTNDSLSFSEMQP